MIGKSALGLCALVVLTGCAASVLGGERGRGCSTCAPAPARMPCLSAKPVDGPTPGSMYYGVGGNIIPSVGVSLHAGRVLWRTEHITGSIEGEVIGQFIDDETFIDDGNPEADPFVQAKLGIKTRNNPDSARHLTFRSGITYFNAGDNPNIVQEPGDYVGVYVGAGFETDLTPNLTVGPELSLTVATQIDQFDIGNGIVPTLSWRATWWPCGNGTSCHSCRQPGELYVDLVGSVSPTFGGGIGFGQVFARDETVVWSFETLANFQSLSDTLLGTSDGNFAQLRGGIKAALRNGGGFGRWVGRAGATFLRNTGDIDGFDEQGDYVGLYAGLGYEFGLGPRITMGPEVAVTAVDLEGLSDVEIEVLPQFLWHVLINL